jgi:transcription termination factor Rho
VASHPETTGSDDRSSQRAGGSSDPEAESPRSDGSEVRADGGEGTPNGGVRTDERPPSDERPERQERFDRDRRDGRQGGGRPDGGQGQGQGRGGQGQSGPGQGGQGQGGPGQANRDRDGGRRRPSREDRRRQRDERRVREVEVREEELATAPTATGLLDVLPEGYGFLRTSGYLPGQQDIYVSLSQVRRFMLRKGDTVTGKVRHPKDSEKYYALLQIDDVNGLDPEAAKERAVFDKLTPLFPDDRFRLETAPGDVTGRIIDMVAPIGKGQRGMVVSPPKAGKTTVLKTIANGIITRAPTPT